MEPTPYDRIRRGEDVLYFLHVPKTAGTTLYAVLDAHFAAREICPWTTLAHLDQVPRERWRGYRLYRGHFGHEFHAFLHSLGLRAVTVTMLRDPVESAVSALHHARRSPTLSAQVLQGQEVVDFVRGPHLGSVVCGRIRKSLVPGEETMAEDETVARATAALDGYAFVGVTEAFEASLALLAHTMGWPPAGPVQRLNVRPTDQAAPLPDDAVRLVRSHLDAEYRVYEHARCLFETRLGRMHRELLDREHRRRFARTPAVAAAHLRFDDALVGHGWHGHEDLAGAEPAPFRWTGPGAESTLDFRLATDRDLLLRAHLLNAVAPEVLASLALHVNGYPVELVTTHRSGLEVVVQGTIPSAVLRRDPELTRLVFSVARTLSKHALDPTDPDRRLLGVCFSQLELAPVAVASPSWAVPRPPYPSVAPLR